MKKSSRLSVEYPASSIWREVASALMKIGYEKDRQKGSHIILRHSAPPNRRITVPDHKEIAKGTLRSIIREAGLTVEQFHSLL